MCQAPYLSSTYYVPGTVLSVGIQLGTKQAEISAFEQMTFWWEVVRAVEEDKVGDR